MLLVGDPRRGSDPADFASTLCVGETAEQHLIFHLDIKGQPKHRRTTDD